MAKRKASSGTPSDEAVKQIANLVDNFCKEHLNDEYADLCIKLVEKLARKRPTPLVSGKPSSWASGIIRTIGWVNFLDDNPMTWMIQVNGFLVDARFLKREIQEEALRKSLIPYIPERLQASD